MTSYQQLRHRARRAVIAVLTILLVATGAVAFLPNAQKAEAALPGGMGDCEFRTSSTTSVSYNLSLQLCWLDLTGIDPNSTTPKQVTKQVGAYTLKFTWTTIRKNATGDPVLLQSRATYSTRAAFGGTSMMTARCLLVAPEARLCITRAARVRLRTTVLSASSSAIFR